ncbi:response regulator [Elusimicrobiota bacterium]
MIKKHILVIDDEQSIIDLLEVNLKNAGYDVSSSTDGLAIVEKATNTKPDLIILDIMLPRISGYEICSKLKEKEETAFIPILILSAKGDPVDKITGLKLGADEYITKPFDVDEIITRVEVLLRKTEQYLSLNPLTHLPGNISIMNEATKRMRQKEKFAFIYADLNNFKAFNDKYGFEKGDNVIKYTAKVIKESLSANDFVGHIGGDDFIVICDSDQFENTCVNITESFDLNITEYYNEEDNQKGYIVSHDRLGNEQRFNIMTLSLGVVIVDYNNIEHYGDIVDRATQMKKYAKNNQNNSHYEVDRRLQRKNI